MEHDSAGQAGAHQAGEITNEMIEAGVGVLWESGAVETPMGDVDRDLVVKIFRSMQKLA